MSVPGKGGMEERGGGKLRGRGQKGVTGPRATPKADV